MKFIFTAPTACNAFGSRSQFFSPTVIGVESTAAKKNSKIKNMKIKNLIFNISPHWFFFCLAHFRSATSTNLRNLVKLICSNWLTCSIPQNDFMQIYEMRRNFIWAVVTYILADLFYALVIFVLVKWMYMCNITTVKYFEIYSLEYWHAWMCLVWFFMGIFGK